MAATSFRHASELPALVSYVRERRCVLFVGAGLSRPAGYPGWGELMRQVVAQTGAPGEDPALRAELEALVERGRFAEVADECRRRLGRTRFGALLRGVLARDVKPPEATHRAIVRTPWSCIVTTNFDTLLEDAYARWSPRGVPKAPTGAELSQHGTLLIDDAFFILKAHGTIHDDESMVFTSEDYRRITHQNPAFQAVISSLLLTRAVLFVGYSLSDPNFRLLIDSQLAAFGSDGPPRYALMEDVGDTERSILRRTTGIEVISFAKGAYGEVARLLRFLAREAGSAAAPAREPLRRIAPAATQVLRLRARDGWIDSTHFATTTADIAGAAVPLDQVFGETAAPPDWLGLEADMAEAASGLPDGGNDPPAACHRVGRLLGACVSGFARTMARQPAGSSVVLDLPADLWPLPWEWIEVDGRPLCLRHAVSRTAPSLRDAARGRPFVRTPLRVLLIGDAKAESPRDAWPLPGSRKLVRALARRIRARSPGATVTVLVGEQACYERVREEIRSGDHDVVQFSGMSAFDADGSYLGLHDGAIAASELVTLLVRRPPALLVLDGVATGFVPAFTPPFPLPVHHGISFDDHHRMLRQRRIGFERAAARAGVGALVATMGLASEEAMGPMLRMFYDALLDGRTVAEALLAARIAGLAGDGDSTAAQLTMCGYGDLRLVAGGGAQRGGSGAA